MRRQTDRQRRRGVALAVTSAALVGFLAACGGSSGDAESPAPETSAPAETSEPAEADSETPAEETPAEEPVEETSEPASEMPDSLAACIESNEASNEADPDTSTETLFNQSAQEFCEEMRDEDPTSFDDAWGQRATSAEEREEVQGEGGADMDAALETCIEMTEDGAGYFENDMPAEESCRWQQGISPDDFAVMYDLTASASEQEEALARFQEAAETLQNY